MTRSIFENNCLAEEKMYFNGGYGYNNFLYECVKPYSCVYNIMAK